MNSAGHERTNVTRFHSHEVLRVVRVEETVVEAGERCRQGGESQTRTGPGPVRSQAAREEVGDGWNPSPQARGKTGPWCKMAGDSWLMGYRVLVLQNENFSKSMAALQCEYRQTRHTHCTPQNGELHVAYVTTTAMTTTLRLSKDDFLGTLSYPGEHDSQVTL